MKCENCEKEHEGTYGSGRFCAKECARGFSTKEKRIEINKKVSLKLSNDKYNGLTKQQFIQLENAEKHASYERENEITTLYDLSKRTIGKILKRMKLPCSKCGWYVEGVVGDIHHILEQKNGGGNEHSNLTYVCPNCHRLIHSNKIEKNELINLDDFIGNEWKDFYYVKNGKLENK
jgi:predicted HNH restriction endonuclease